MKVDLKEIQARHNALVERHRALVDEFQNEARKNFQQTAKSIFDACPAVNSIIWNQYTPYFNDGEECVFNVHEPYFTNATDVEWGSSMFYGDMEDDDETVWLYGSYSDENLPKDLDTKTLDWFAEMIQSNEMQDVMRDMFGDHVQIIVTRDGIEVEEYDHE